MCAVNSEFFRWLRLGWMWTVSKKAAGCFIRGPGVGAMPSGVLEGEACPGSLPQHVQGTGTDPCLIIKVIFPIQVAWQLEWPKLNSDPLYRLKRSEESVAKHLV